MTVKILIPISGGKDSQACLKLALESHAPEDVRGLFCDTQWEHPKTYAHVDLLRCLYGNIQIDTVTGGSMLEKVVKHKRWPGGGARHCTDELKIRETKIYCRQLAEQQGSGFEVWYGMRSSESSERNKRYAGKVCDELYAPHEVIPSKYPKYLAKMGVMFRLAILSWSDSDVFRFLEGKHNPLYNDGFPRVGCFPCGASGDRYKVKAFNYDEFGREQHQKVIAIQNQIGKSILTSKRGRADSENNQLCMLGVCE